MPRSGLLTIASILSERSRYRVELLFEPYVGQIDVARLVSERPHAILLNGLTTSAPAVEALVRRIREGGGESIPVIAGGEHATMFPADAANYADFVVLHEGDDTILSLLEALEAEDPRARAELIAAIPGLFYRHPSGRLQRTAGTRRVSSIDYRFDYSIVTAAEGAAARFRLTQAPLQTSRGCTHHCSFCSWMGLFGGCGYHERPIDDVVHDVVETVRWTRITRFMVVDNLFTGDPQYTEALVGRLESVDLGPEQRPSFTVLCRADQFAGEGALPDSFLVRMHRAGITHVSIGMESLNADSLRRMGKRTTVGTYRTAAQRLRAYGFRVAATFVTGFAEDSLEDVRAISAFADEIGCFTIQVYAHAITPGAADTRSAHRAIRGIPRQFLNGHAVSVLPLRMLPSELQAALFETAARFYDRSREPQRRLVGAVYRHVRRSMQPYELALQRFEREILLPEQLYVPDRTGSYRLQEEPLQRVLEDTDRRTRLDLRLAAIFRECCGDDGGVYL
jgi:radical SAM superfamily enzyme YgiQ (UPF0313 family)